MVQLKSPSEGQPFLHAGWHQPRADLFRVTVALFLLVAAGLKVHGLAIESLPQSSVLFSWPFQVMATCVEFILGFLLLTKSANGLARYGCLVFFATGVCANLMAVLQRQGCGCFGEVGRALSISPWMTLVLDLALLVGLWNWRPVSEARTHVTFCSKCDLWLHLRWPILVASVLWLSALMIGVIAFGSAATLWAFMQGHTLVPDSYHKDLGKIHVGKVAVVDFAMKNIGSRPVTIVGVEPACRCELVNNDSLPVTILPGKKGDLLFSIVPAAGLKPGVYRFSARVFVDLPGPNVIVEFSGEVDGD